MNQIKLESLLKQFKQVHGIGCLNEQQEYDIRKVVKEYKGDVEINSKNKLSTLQRAVLRSIELQKGGDGQTIDFKNEDKDLLNCFGIGVDLSYLSVMGMPFELDFLELFPLASLFRSDLFSGESLSYVSFLIMGNDSSELNIANHSENLNFIHVGSHARGNLSSINVGSFSKERIDNVFVGNYSTGGMSKISVGANGRDVSNIFVGESAIGKITDIKIGENVHYDGTGQIFNVCVGNSAIGVLENVKIGDSSQGIIANISVGDYMQGNVNDIEIANSSHLVDVKNISVGNSAQGHVSNISVANLNINKRVNPFNVHSGLKIENISVGDYMSGELSNVDILKGYTKHSDLELKLDSISIAKSIDGTKRDVFICDSNPLKFKLAYRIHKIFQF